jgi:hypothetical protein
VDRAYGPVDQERWWFTVHLRRRAAKSSPEQVLVSAAGPDCPPRVGKKVEEAVGFLIGGFNGWSRGGDGLAMVMKWRWRIIPRTKR